MAVLAVPDATATASKRQPHPPFDQAALGRGAFEWSNAAIASKFGQLADILAAQSADPYRIAAYREAADVLLALPGGCRRHL